MAAVANRQEPLLAHGFREYAEMVQAGAIFGAVVGLHMHMPPQVSELVSTALYGAATLSTAMFVLDLTRNIEMPEFENRILNRIAAVFSLILRVGVCTGIGIYAGVSLAGLAGYAIHEGVLMVTASVALGVAFSSLLND